MVLEALRRQQRAVVRVRLDERARPEGKVGEILSRCKALGVPVERVPRHLLDRHSDTGVHNGVMALAEPLPSYTVQQLLDELFERGELPFLALVDEVQYEHNLGAVMRSAMVPVSTASSCLCVVERASARWSSGWPWGRERWFPWYARV